MPQSVIWVKKEVTRCDRAGEREANWRGSEWPALRPLPKPVPYSYQPGNLSFLTNKSGEENGTKQRSVHVSVTVCGGTEPAVTGSAVTDDALAAGWCGC